jgi:hypothetical protein
MYPNLNYGQYIPGLYYDKGRAWGIITCRGFVEILQSIELLYTSKYYTQSDEQELKKWFGDYLNWLLTSDLGKEASNSKNNHSVAYDVQVVTCALFLGKDSIARNIIENFPQMRIFKQIEVDGSQPLELARTKAFHYSVFNLNFFIDISFLAKKIGIDLINSTSSDGKSIVKAIEFLIPYLGTKVVDFPYKQITDWGKQEDLYWLIIRSNSLLSKPDYSEIYTRFLLSSNSDINNILYKNH